MPNPAVTGSSSAWTSSSAKTTRSISERRDGKGGKQFVKAYAMRDPKEYFAECTEAFFSRNDFYPFNRTELQQHDPDVDALLVRLWGRKS